jgi:hypothetical protein
MKPIHSKLTFFHKRIFPLIWFGMFGVFLVAIAAGWINDRGRPMPAPFYLMPFIMLFIGFVLMRYLISPLADEVLDGGEFLLVKKGGVEERISFANVRNVSYQDLVNPPRVTLSLREDTRLGREIVFMPPQRFGGILRGKNPLVEDLIDRIDRARSK